MPVALIYRDKGPVSLELTAGAAGDCLRDAGWDVVFVGPRERVRALSADVLREADLYVQPGGGDDLDAAWAVIGRSKAVLRDFVAGGGRYVGVCMGGFLAGAEPGFELLPGDAEEYIKTRGAEVKHGEDAEVNLSWRGQARRVYFQAGPSFKLDAGARGAEVLATYSNGRAAALVAPFGAGAVGVVGPHPEASADWYADCGMSPSACEDLFIDLVDSTMACGGGKLKPGHVRESKEAVELTRGKPGADHQHARQQEGEEEEEEEDGEGEDDDDDEDDDDEEEDGK
jgi:hypothetical protein